MEKPFNWRYVSIFTILFAIAFFATLTYRQGHRAQPLQTDEKLVPKAFRLPNSEDHWISSKEAPYTLLYYSDYDCPYCTKTISELKSLDEDFPTLNIVLRQLPLTQLHPEAFKKATLAECLAAKGGDFIKISTALFSKQGVSLSDISPETIGAENRTEMDACFENHQAQSKVTISQTGAVASGLYTTPSFVLIKNGQIIAKMNYVTDERLRRVIAPILAKK